MGLLGGGVTVVLVAAGLFSAVQDVGSVRIHRLDVPGSVQNGTQASVVLDCDYSYDANETEGLVVSWYFGAKDEPVYQWIPHFNKQQGLGQLRGRLDLDYQAHGDKYKMHRALRILQPTTELSGAYTCKVSSLQHEEVRSANMVVYAPATNMSVCSEKPSAGSVNVTCQAQGVFPRPHLRLFTNRTEVKDVVVERTRRTEEDGGVFDVAVHRTFSDRDLPWQTEFLCELSIPGVSYREERQLSYYTGPATTAALSTPTSQGAALSQGGSDAGVRNQPTAALSAFIVTTLLLHAW